MWLDLCFRKITDSVIEDGLKEVEGLNSVSTLSLINK